MILILNWQIHLGFYKEKFLYWNVCKAKIYNKIQQDVTEKIISILKSQSIKTVYTLQRIPHLKNSSIIIISDII